MSPLEIEIALHYWSFPKPYKNGSENWNDLESKIVHDMVAHGLLEQNADDLDGKTMPNSLYRLSGNTPAMRVYVQALQAVPWPTRVWVIPAAGSVPKS